MKIAIVAPCHIPPSEAWINSLQAEATAGEAEVIIVDDSNGNLGVLPENWTVLNYAKQEEFLGELYEDFATMFHKCSACRVVGNLYAYVNGYDVIIGLDSDCIVERHFVKSHVQYLDSDYGCGWFNPLGFPNYSRGYPYSQRQWKVKANMGLWKNVLDINGKDRQPNEPKEIKIMGNTVPDGYFPFSGMNWAIGRDAILGFLFLPNFQVVQNGLVVDDFRRIDDVWGGYIFEKLLRKLHWSSMLGYPIVFHDTIVDAAADAEEEEAMYKYEDAFIAAVDEASMMALHTSPGQTTMAEAMQGFIHSWSEAYGSQPFAPLTPAFLWWGKVIEKYADK